MAFGPISYDTGAESPLAAFNQGIQSGANVVNTQLQQAQNTQALQQQQQFSKDVASVISSGSKPMDIANLAMKYPSMADKIKASSDMTSQAQQDAKLQSSIPIYTALQGGNVDTAVKLMNQQADAYDNAGKPQEAQQYRTMSTYFQNHPDNAKFSAGWFLAGQMGAQKFSELAKSLGEETRANELQPGKVAEQNAQGTIKSAEASAAPETVALKNADTSSQVAERAARLGLDKDKLTSEMQLKREELNQKFGELKPEATKLVNDSVQAATASEQTASQWNMLASKLTAADTKGKWATPFSAVGEVFGANVDAKALRQEYVRLRSSGMLKELPPGNASDKDMAEVKNGFPSENDNAETVARFARGMAKLSYYDAALNNAKSEWVGSVGHLGKTKSDIVVNGVKVPAGSTFDAFARKFIAAKAGELEQKSVTQEVQNSPYFKFASPQQ